MEVEVAAGCVGGGGGNEVLCRQKNVYSGLVIDLISLPLNSQYIV